MTVLSDSKDKIALHKAAKVIGDRSIERELKLSAEETASIGRVVTGYLDASTATDANERVEAKQQIERLWHAAAPTLLENLSGGGDLTKAELAIKSLILMRNEEIIKGIIKKAKSTSDEQTRALAVLALQKMKEQRKSLIPGRKCLGEEESKRLYESLVLPALKELGAEPE